LGGVLSGDDGVILAGQKMTNGKPSCSCVLIVSNTKNEEVKVLSNGKAKVIQQNKISIIMIYH